MCVCTFLILPSLSDTKSLIHLLKIVFLLMLSVSHWPKVITLSGFTVIVTAHHNNVQGLQVFCETITKSMFTNHLSSNPNNHSHHYFHILTHNRHWFPQINELSSKMHPIDIKLWLVHLMDFNQELPLPFARVYILT
jgi:hypothetical protein